ncbi:PD-(D/E)XK nuclease family protein [Acetohalobium arabaticum]|uniref:PD-(D/E)XK nuclease family protein n=1 Tax=Acetohalobium arabaticum TaxID=28187 RepID=UPI0005A2A615|nr:PD-(D/E)XK nuclease family protein [Acetohalobium arabaticum]
MKIPDNFDSFILDGIEIYAVPDLIYKNQAGRTIIVDWKTGNPKLKEDMKQLEIYAYYCFHNFNSSQPITARLEYLKTGKKHEKVVFPEEKERIASEILDSAARMKAYLADKKENIPLPKEKFIPQCQERKYTNCKFRGFCPG